MEGNAWLVDEGIRATNPPLAAGLWRWAVEEALQPRDPIGSQRSTAAHGDASHHQKGSVWQCRVCIWYGAFRI
eukprot:1361900-Prymnesium_polylepis.1